MRVGLSRVPIAGRWTPPHLNAAKLIDYLGKVNQVSHVLTQHNSMGDQELLSVMHTYLMSL